MGGKQSKEKGVYARGGRLYIDIATPEGRKKRALGLDDTKPNRAYAKNLLGEIRLKIAMGTFRSEEYFGGAPEKKQAAAAFGEFAAQWLAGQDHLATATWEGYRKILNCYFMPAMAERPLQDITHTELAATIAGITWKSNKTRNNAITPLRRVFEAALLDGIIKVDPAARIKFAKEQKPMPDPLTLDEVDAVLDWMKRHPVFHNYFELAFFTGLRTSELIALKWGDVDWRRETVTVQRARVRNEVKGTKTASVREIELNSRALAALSRQKASTFLSGEWVFLHPSTGLQMVNDKPPRLVWTSALKACGLRHRDAYQTRHTFATLALMSGALPMWVSRQLGHTNMGMLLARYSRWIDAADNGKERSKMEEKISSAAQLRNMATERKG